jgi:ATP-binding cassette subfamily C (CFTR/MRP) protein 1
MRSNVEFGTNPNESRLQSVVDACALRRDLDLMVDGLSTEIGEKGINLSGGQRQRVSLCRAAMSDTDIVLMDDPVRFEHYTV